MTDITQVAQVGEVWQFKEDVTATGAVNTYELGQKFVLSQVISRFYNVHEGRAWEGLWITPPKDNRKVWITDLTLELFCVRIS